MAGKKKKKPAANPARGFATVSIASKTKENVTIDEDSQIDLPDTTKSVVFESLSLKTDQLDARSVAQDENDKAIQDMTPEELEQHLELAELQQIVQEHATKVRADATRQFTRLIAERRHLRQQSEEAIIPGLTETIMNEILKCNTLNTDSGLRQTFAKSAAAATHDTDLLLKLWTLQAVLLLLRMPTPDDALEHTLNVLCTFGTEKTTDFIPGLDICLRWYAKSKSAFELPDYVTGNVEGSNAIERTGDGVSDDESIGEQFRMPETGNKSKTANTDIVIPMVITEIESSSDDECYFDEDEDDPDKLVDLWLRLQSKKFAIESSEVSEGSKIAARRRKLTERLQKIERDILFDEYAAMQQWQPILMDLQIEVGKARKQQHYSQNLHESPMKVHDIPQDRTIDDMDGILGGIFGDEDSMSTPAASLEESSSVTVLDYGSWTGLHPRRLFEETATDQIKKSGLRFTRLLVTSHSARLRCDIYWEKDMLVDESSQKILPPGITFIKSSRRWRFDMVEIATKTVLQAESLLTALSLFLFACLDITYNKHIQRLPKVWKEMLTDLMDQRRLNIAEQDVKNLQHLRKLINKRPKIPTGNAQVGLKKQIESNRSAANNRNPVFRMSADKATSRWLQRTRSPAFAKMSVFREGLPVFKFKHKILQAFDEQPVLIICADTGAGKSTQIPSYILEHNLSAGHDYNIMVTQPRRISAVSIARRVSAELGEEKDALGTSRSLVGYAIRMESKTSSETRITFATTGVLLRMLQSTHNLENLDCLVLDEVHERTMDLDLLFIALKQLHKRRPDLKIVLMSATVDATKFSRYFNDAPVLDIPGRTFPVEVGFLEDAIENTIGLNGLDSTSNSQYYSPDDSGQSDTENAAKRNEGDLSKYSASTRGALDQYDETRINYELILKLASAIATLPKYSAYSSAILIFMPGLGEIRRLHNLLLSSRVFSSKWMIHMLHSTFSTQDLEQAFVIPSRGFRKIVIATNIAETGVTIPDITAVIDTCKEKIMRFDERRQLSRLTEGFIARASARQRKGRAARVRDGLCFHLVTRHRFEKEMLEQPVPEMLRLSLQDPILRVKTWNLGPAEEVLAAAIDPPTMKNVRRALSKLQDVGALNTSENLTSLGVILARLPLDALLGKMIVFSVLFQCLDAVATIIASFGIKSIFLEGNGASNPRIVFAKGDSDFLTLYNAYTGWKKALDAGTSQQFCHKYHLNQSQLQQLDEQKAQLILYLAEARVIALDEQETGALQRARNTRSGSHTFQVPTRYDRMNGDSMVSAVIAIALHPKLLRRDGHGFRNVYTNQHLQLASTSVNRLSGKPPNWLCYLEASQARNGKLNASYSSRVTQATLAMLLGDCDLKLFSGVIDLDNGRVRLSLRNWKDMIALQGLRTQTQSVVEKFLKNPDALLEDVDQQWLETVADVLNGPPPPRSH